MAHVVRNMPWGLLDIDKQAGRILFQQRWAYRWVEPTSWGGPRWTSDEKRSFHNECDKAIWAIWSNRIRLRAHGDSEFARKHRTVSINFDIKRVSGSGHWNVNVLKLPPGKYQSAWVNWQARTMELHNLVYTRLTLETDTGVARYGQRIVTHEFGHAIGNTSSAPALRGRDSDEYHADSQFIVDTASIMNVGTQVRDRHLAQVLMELNQMIPNCAFSC